MVNRETGRVTIAVIVAAAMIGICSCTVQTYQPVSVPLGYTPLGSVLPVYNPPPNTPFHCIGVGSAVTLASIPGDPAAPLPMSTEPVATMGNRRGDWLLVVTHTGEIGWMYDPKEESYSQVHPGQWCHVYQDAQGRIVFHYQLVYGSY
jgi:hypothetical protein